jgi:hypothetical protein
VIEVVSFLFFLQAIDCNFLKFVSDSFCVEDPTCSTSQLSEELTSGQARLYIKYAIDEGLAQSGNRLLYLDQVVFFEFWAKA